MSPAVKQGECSDLDDDLIMELDSGGHADDIDGRKDRIVNPEINVKQEINALAYPKSPL